jgi:flagellar basal body rod protein FlgC
MSTIMSIGVGGLSAAETRVEIRAINIVNAPARDARHFTPVQTTRAAIPVVRAQPTIYQAPSGPFVDLAEDIVDMRAALHAYRASAAIVRTGSEMQQTLLDALS